MKKKFKQAAAAVVLGSVLLTWASPVFAGTPVYVNSQYRGEAVLEKGRTLVQLRLLEGQGWLTLDYNQETRTVHAKNNDTQAEVQIKAGERTALVNGDRVQLDVPAVMKEGRILVPLRFLSESIGVKVVYNPEHKYVVIRSALGEERYKKIMSGELTEARNLAATAGKVNRSNMRLVHGEGYWWSSYVFPEGEALRFTTHNKGTNNYYEINGDGLAGLKWQEDLIGEQSWGVKPNLQPSIYFMDQFMASLYSYGRTDTDGKSTEIGSYYYNLGSHPAAVTIEGEVRIDAREVR
ncbi:copper amine oxidase N-terminal domain-containing protein [Paenibacillus daejeonensis]|uniref:copper amine oxidase N-terminal domain-containing protein n=1 Tax=Paenibacillus daejeonensis TaxID=135193 RepID=UPI00037D11CE|nr:copper amine oxidase N-terminal domain-containing protein [Paenibacillus daejeonensis]